VNAFQDSKNNSTEQSVNNIKSVIFSKNLKSEVVLGLAKIEGVNIQKSSFELLELIKTKTEEVRNHWKLEDFIEQTPFKEYRKLWWAHDMDPTKLRPSAEALIRRLLLGKDLYLINNVVDSMNLVSIDSALSIGLHDLDKLKFPLEVRLAKDGEEFTSIGSKGSTTLSGHELLVSDQEKGIDLAYSTSSSELSKITDETRNALFVVYAPANVEFRETLESGSELVAKYGNGKVTSLEVYSNE